MANILFVLKSCDIGGVEVVTIELANKFAKEGHRVVIWAFYRGETTLEDRIEKEIKLVYGNGFKTSSGNIQSLRETLLSNNIELIINQWGLPYVPARTIKKATVGLNVKIIAAYHNDPLANERLKSVEFAMEKCKSLIKKVLLNIKYKLFFLITSASMRYTYNHCDKFMLLSYSFIERFQKFTKLHNVNKLFIIANPVTINTDNFSLDFTNKTKEIVYVGRLNHNQKRVSRIIDVWSLLEKAHPDWHLSVIGDGPEKDAMINLTNKYNLKNIFFEGYKDPRPYYERASILLLVSEFEGFGLVIVEGMCFGVVPVVLGSYPAVYDIIDDKINGIIVPYKKDIGFDAQKMADEIERIISLYNEKSIKKLGLSAYEKSKKFSMDLIYDEWERVFEELCVS